MSKSKNEKAEMLRAIGNSILTLKKLKSAPAQLLQAGGRLIEKALKLGAFNRQEHTTLRNQTEVYLTVEDPHISGWAEFVLWLKHKEPPFSHSDIVENFSADCDLVAKAILDEAEAIEQADLARIKPAETGQNDEVRNEVMRDLVFICYSHKDKRWLEDLETHLKPSMRGGSITAWSDKQIVPGSKWMKEIEAALAATKVAVLLVTPNFLASDFINENELGTLLKRAEKGKVTIIWVPVRACSYKETPLKDYQAAIDSEKPLANMKAERDKAWVKICEEIKKSVR
jgi:hypothetical protein